jgi:DNA repair protein RecO (recombination protein O)
VIIKTKALVIREYIVGESDKYITLFTKELGKIQVIAPKGKKYDKGFASGTQLFVYGEFILTSYHTTYRLMNVEIINMFHDIRKDLNVLSYASYIAEFVQEVTHEGVGQEKLLMLTLVTLKSLMSQNSSLKLMRGIFELRALSILGFMPELEKCVECHEELEENENTVYFFGSEAGGILCNKCSMSYKERLKISYSTLYTMKYIIHTSFNCLYAFNVSPVVLQELEKVCRHYTAYYISKRFKSAEFIDQIEDL